MHYKDSFLPPTSQALKLNQNHHRKIYIFDSDLVWRMQLMIIKG